MAGWLIVVVASHCAPASSLRRSLLLLDAPHARALALPVAASGGLAHRRPCPPSGGLAHGLPVPPHLGGLHTDWPTTDTSTPLLGRKTTNQRHKYAPRGGKMLRARKDTTPETPIDGARWWH